MHVSTIEAVAIAAPIMECEGRDIYRAMQFLAKRCDDGRATAILACVLIEPDHGGAKLTVTDLESRHSVTIPARWELPGAMAIESRAFAGIVKGLRGGNVRLKAWRDEPSPFNSNPPPVERVRVSGGRSVFNVRDYGADNFPLAGDDLRVIEAALNDLAAIEKAAAADKASKRKPLEATFDAWADVDGKQVPISNGRGGITLTAEQVAEMCGDDLFETVAFPMPDGLTGYVLKWQLDDGDKVLLTVPRNGKLTGKPRVFGGVLHGATVRHEVTRDYVLAAIAGEAPAVSCETPAPEIAPQTPQDVQEAACATHAAPKPEIAPTASPADDLTPADALPDIDAIMARLDAVESAVAELPRIRMKAIAVRMDEPESDTPSSVENGTDAGDAGNVIAWPGARAMHVDRAAADAERKAHERAKRERLVRRYLAMRRERSSIASQRVVWSRRIDDLERKLASMTEEADYQRRHKEKAREENKHLSASLASQAAVETLWKCIAGEAGYSARLAEKRRRAVALARDLQKRLNAEHRMVEHYSEKHNKACEHNRRLNNELSALKAKLECPSTPDRVSDVAMLRAENSAVRDELALVKADRDRLANVADNHAGAISALVDRIARAEAAMRRAGINAGPVAVAA